MERKKHLMETNKKKIEFLTFLDCYIRIFIYLCTLKYLTGTSSRKIQTLCQ